MKRLLFVSASPITGSSYYNALVPLLVLAHKHGINVDAASKPHAGYDGYFLFRVGKPAVVDFVKAVRDHAKIFYFIDDCYWKVPTGVDAVSGDALLKLAAQPLVTTEFFAEQVRQRVGVKPAVFNLVSLNRLIVFKNLPGAPVPLEWLIVTEMPLPVIRSTSHNVFFASGQMNNTLMKKWYGDAGINLLFQSNIPFYQSIITIAAQCGNFSFSCHPPGSERDLLDYYHCKGHTKWIESSILGCVPILPRGAHCKTFDAAHALCRDSCLWYDPDNRGQLAQTLAAARSMPFNEIQQRIAACRAAVLKYSAAAIETMCGNIVKTL